VAIICSVYTCMSLFGPRYHGQGFSSFTGFHRSHIAVEQTLTLQVSVRFMFCCDKVVLECGAGKGSRISVGPIM
jgi:hypothetical protein